MSTTTSTNGTKAATPKGPSKAAGPATWADERLGLAKANKMMPLRKVFPDHWSFMLG